MKRFLQRTRVRLLLMAGLGSTAALSTGGAIWSMHEPAEAANMRQQMKTVCVGRFLIDVPANAQVTLSRASVQGFDIVNYGVESKEKFEARVASREEEINAVKNMTGQKNMVSVRDVRDEDVEGRIFVSGFSSGYLFENAGKVVYSSVAVDGFARVNSVTYTFRASTYKPEDVGELEGLLKKLKPLGPDIIPTQSGFCLDGALVLDPPSANDGERIVMFAGLPGHEDLGIALATLAGTTPGPGLLERNAANRAGPYAFLNAFLSTLLEGKRSINGMEGDELAFRARERNFSTGYTFDWEMQGTKDNVMRPLVSLELQTGLSLRAGGQPVQSSLSEAAVSDLWRRMSSSLRVRPVVQPAQSGGLSLRPALAQDARASAGETCRQSGSRQCGQADAHARRGPLPALAPDAAPAPRRAAAAAGAVITVTPA
jgi:hypothetical protein